MIVFDLDDTLCKEIDFLKSAYREISNYTAQMFIGCQLPVQELGTKAYETMLAAYQSGGNAFEALNALFGLNVPLADYLQMYREHLPQIELEEDVRETLDRFKSKGVLMGIVSDGRELTQWNKINALGLTKWIDESYIIINSSPDSYKPNPCGYERVETAARDLMNGDAQFTYVGDNLEKDFICPKQKGWYTICVKDDGRNIHSQDFYSTPEYAMPDRVIDSLKELC